MRLIELIKKQFQDSKVGGIKILKAKAKYLFWLRATKQSKLEENFIGCFLLTGRGKDF